MKPLRPRLPEAVLARYPEYFAAPRSNGRFRNPWDHPGIPRLSNVMRWKLQRNTQRERGYRPEARAIAPHALADFEALAGPTRLFWIGHASFLLELDRVRFVIDPIFGRAGGLVRRVTPAAATPAELTGLRAVLVTHGHHDHLDPAGLRALAIANEGRATFVTPLGLAGALPEECRPAIELDWWECIEFEGVRVQLVPAQHWHRRGAFDLNKSLWGGFVLAGSHRVYHSGDTGYFGGFRAIGEVFGGIDVACLPLGAYEPRWFMGAQHMSPEQAIDAFRDLGAAHFVGMHWGAYDLSDEPIDAGPKLAAATALERGLDPKRLHVLEPGGSLALQGPPGEAAAQVRHGWQPSVVAPTNDRVLV